MNIVIISLLLFMAGRTVCSCNVSNSAWWENPNR